MKREPSDWYFPRDWRWILSWYFVVMPIALISFLFLPALSEARPGNPILLYVALCLGLVGVVLLFCARVPLCRQRKFFSFGPRGLSVLHRRLYWTAYGFIGVAIGIMVFLLLTLK